MQFQYYLNLFKYFINFNKNHAFTASNIVEFLQQHKSRQQFFLFVWNNAK